jgi:DNA-directed RNA polymerase subunit M/transcription elongation factor TFIIS
MFEYYVEQKLSPEVIIMTGKICARLNVDLKKITYALIQSMSSDAVKFIQTFCDMECMHESLNTCTHNVDKDIDKTCQNCLEYEEMFWTNNLQHVMFMSNTTLILTYGRNIIQEIYRQDILKSQIKCKICNVGSVSRRTVQFKRGDEPAGFIEKCDKCTYKLVRT